MPMRKDLDILHDVIARKHIYRFAQAVVPKFEESDFHRNYYEVLNLFAHGQIRRLIVTIPPQHGKSLGSSQVLPAYMLGLNPDLKIAIASYSFVLASKFNRYTQRIITSAEYSRIFPLTKLKENSQASDAGGFVQTSEMFEIVGRDGSLQAVGRGGGLTGNKINVQIIDDLYKDAAEGNSPTIRDAVAEWDTSVVKTRQHNNAQELIVFTRWHEDDLIGRYERLGIVRDLNSLSQVDPDFDGYYKLNFEALKESPPTEIDPREDGAPLWPSHHNVEALIAKRKLDAHAFNTMYQGRPMAREGLLYGDEFQTYTTLPANIVKRANYTDTADMGDDRLCSICYVKGSDSKIYITDVLFTPEPMEVTEPATAQMLRRNETRESYIESNNGGRSFARAVERLAPAVSVQWFHQSKNKESRILTNSAAVLKNIVMPADWALRWPDFYNNVVTYRRSFKANRWHDAADVLTGIVEKETFNNNYVIL